MLHLFGPPRWAPDGASPRELPVTAPAALAVYLAAQGGGWCSRESVAAVFWPDRSPADALHALRITLHRLRNLLDALGVDGAADALQAERQRLRLALPCGRLPSAGAPPDGQPWLQGFRVAGFAGFQAWADRVDPGQGGWDGPIDPARPSGPADAIGPAGLVGAAAPDVGGQPGAAVPPTPGRRRTPAGPGATIAVRHRAPAEPDAADRPAVPGGADAPADGVRSPAWPPSAAAPATALPGREAELARLLAAAGPAHLLLGEPGLGKSSLLAAAWGDSPCLQGRQGLESVPFAPLVAALRHELPRLARRVAGGAGGGAEAGDALAAYRLDLARLLPELAPGEPLPPLDAQTAKTRLMEALCLAWLPDRQPLRVDDLQWCDAATVEWLVFAAHRGRPRWRAAARPRELADAPVAVRQGLEALASAGRLTRQDLGRMDRDAVARACRQRWPGHAWTERTVAALHAAGGGNPFVLAELVRAELAQSRPAGEATRPGHGGEGGGVDAGPGVGAPGADAAAAGLSAPLPPAVTRQLLARLQALPGPARRMVEASAVLAEAASPALLALLADLPPPAQVGLDGALAAADAGGGAASAMAHAAAPGEVERDPTAQALADACEAELLTWVAADGAAWPEPPGSAGAGDPAPRPGRLQCRHDLVRQAVVEALPAVRRQALHRRCALALASPAGPDAGGHCGGPGVDGRPPDRVEALRVALHWQAAGEAQTALAWQHRGGRQLQALGRFDEARALWQRVSVQATEPALALRARLALAEHRLWDDLAEGRAALQAVLDQVGAVADPEARAQLEGEALAGLVDNAVFSGDLPRAGRLAARLRPLLPRLPVAERVHACEVLIELAMREPDVDGAQALLRQVQRLAPAAPSTLSFAAQVHWFAGDARAARDAFEALLQRYPEHRRALTLENDLAVMLHALGEVHRAEAMARASLVTWAGVAHTESLSLLVLGAVLLSAGRLAEADQALLRALALARQQASAGFTAEALVRRARVALAGGRVADARALLDEAETQQPLQQPGAVEPLRASAAALTRLLCGLAAAGDGRGGTDAARAAAAEEAAGAADAAHAVDTGSAPALAVLRHAAAHSAHPLVQLRWLRAEVAVALAGGRLDDALPAARRLHGLATQAGLLEWQAEGQLLQVQVLQRRGAPAAALRAELRDAATLALTQGLAELRWRALCGLVALSEPGSTDRQRAQAEVQAARRQLEAGGGFDADAAAACLPGWGV